LTSVRVGPYLTLQPVSAFRTIHVMKIGQKTAIIVATALCVLTLNLRMIHAQAPDARRTQSSVVLSREQAAAVLPPTVFFRGQSASIQARNSAGLRAPDGKLVLVTMVDTSGYSSSIQETYQAYLLTELPLTIAGKKLPPGAYGFGFIAGNNMVVMDIGSNELLRVTTTRDESLARPNPLQILSDNASGTFRLYLGRSYVAFSPAER
jgi:hypothetical protein